MKSITMANHEDHLTNSIEEDDPQEPDVGPVARSYECMFCRSGFTTAQALGGHMNIHRKDRAKGSRPNYMGGNYNSNKQDHSSYATPIFHHQVYTSSCPQPYISKTHNNQEGNARYTTCSSSISSAAELVDHENNNDCCGLIKSTSRDEKMMSLLEFGWSHDGEDDHRASATRNIRAGSDDDELDLELRLGHDPFKLHTSDGKTLFSSSQNVFLG